MYRFNYDIGGNDQAPVSPMTFDARVYSIADKYEVLMLKSLAKEKFKQAVKTCWNMDDFPETLIEVYSSTPRTDRGLRDLVVEIVCKHIQALLEKQDFQTALDEIVGLAADVSRYMANENALTKSRSYKCANCHNTWEAVLSPGSKYHCVFCGSRYYWEMLVVDAK